MRRRTRGEGKSLIQRQAKLKGGKTRPFFPGGGKSRKVLLGKMVCHKRKKEGGLSHRTWAVGGKVGITEASEKEEAAGSRGRARKNEEGRPLNPR